MAAPNKLLYGDDLDIMRDHIPDASVDLVYLDPPFNSKRDYNVLLMDKVVMTSADTTDASPWLPPPDGVEQDL